MEPPLRHRERRYATSGLARRLFSPSGSEPATPSATLSWGIAKERVESDPRTSRIDVSLEVWPVTGSQWRTDAFELPVPAIGPEWNRCTRSIFIDTQIPVQLLLKLQRRRMQAQAVPSAIWIVLACACSTLGQTGDSKSLRDATAALRGGDAQLADQIATNYLEGQNARDRNALWIRANAREALQDYSAAALDFESLAQLDPAEPRILLALGGALFKAGDIDASIEAFDAAAALDASLGPHLWQRGISHYYAGRLGDCARQFEIHRTVNPQDVENSVWHFLCVAAEKGFDAARSGLIPIDRDGRIPMMEVFGLFGGSVPPEEVLGTAERAADAGHGAGPVFYAHLYLGLYFEARRDPERSAHHISEAVRQRQPTNYMWQVARVHQQLREDDN